jgi:hypothetical protein
MDPRSGSVPKFHGFRNTVAPPVNRQQAEALMGEQRRPPVTLTRFNGNKRPAEPMELDHGTFSFFFSKNPHRICQFSLASYWSGRVLNISSGTRNMLLIRWRVLRIVRQRQRKMTNTTLQSQIFLSQDGDFFISFVIYAILPHLTPLRFHCM